MTLIDAPAYDPARDNLKRNILIGILAFVGLVAVVGLGGFFLGHGWFFSNLPAEHKVNNFLTALEQNDYKKAYGIYYNDADWQQHPGKYPDYPFQRFTEDWTTHSPVLAPITSHQIFISKTEGSGTFGTGIIVATQLNHVAAKCAFIRVDRGDGTLTWPAIHEIGYEKCGNI